MTCRSPSSEAASAAWPRPCRCCGRESTCRCSSRRRPSWRSARASRSARTHRGCCTAGACAARDRTGVRPVAVHQRRWDDGRTLQRAPLGEAAEAAFGAPYYHFHRADLLEALADALPPERLRLGHRLAGFTDHGDRVELRFASGTTVSADVLVGADGIHSTVRGEPFGPA